MITNVLATLIVCIVTNVYAPKQYKSVVQIMTYPATTEEVWSDVPTWMPMGMVQDTRDNPDVRIVEVREVRKWRFNLEGVPDHVISDKIIRRTERRRTVKQEETWTEQVTMDVCGEAMVINGMCTATNVLKWSVEVGRGTR